jgi:folate-dependent phosphoribosylglycinamide formyltransferase PurN
VNRLLDRHDVVGIVVESPPLASDRQTKIERRKKLLARHGFYMAVNKLAYNWFRSRCLSRHDGDAIVRTLFPDGREPCYARSVPTTTVPTINDSKCVEFIRERTPDLIAVCGTGVVKPEVFSLSPRGAVNIHTGITPEYRSADPIFWALYQNEPEKVGVTIHFIDKGIDTGPIIHQESVPLYATDTLATIYARCVQRGAELYLQTLQEIENGAARMIDRSEVKGKAFYSIDLGLIQYAIFRRRFRKILQHLPRETDAAAVELIARMRR